MKEATTDLARGRWRDILPELGVDQKFLTKKHGPCPACGGTDRFSFDDRSGDGDYICRGCGAGKGLGLLMKVTGLQFKEAAQRVDKVLGNAAPLKWQSSPVTVSAPNRAVLRKLWLESEPATAGGQIGEYLASRGIDYIPACLRYARLRHRSDGTTYPVMVALFSGPDGKGATLHKTFLTEDGGKAAVDPVRQFMPG